MDSKTETLWPYTNKAALVAAPLCWLAFAAMILATRRFLAWPGAQTGQVVLLLATAIGFVPIVLAVFDSIVRSRGVLDIRGIKIDFSQAAVARSTFELPANMGKAGPVVPDVNPTEVVAALESATENQIVQVDIKDGDEWWVTRLMALCAGARRAGSPKAIVFVGMKDKVDGIFLGSCFPDILLDVLRSNSQPYGPVNITYGAVYERAVRIAKQVAIFADDGAPPAPQVGMRWVVPPGFGPEVYRYLNDPKYARLGEASLEQILMDQFGRYDLETPPDRLTLNRLEELFSHRLYRDAIDIRWSKKKQAEVFVKSEAPFLALVYDGKYKVLVERGEIEREIIKELLIPT